MDMHASSSTLQQKGHSRAVGSSASGLIAIAITLGLACLNQVRGQNLVPNGSFEQYTSCPEFISSVFLTGWENLHTTSADYFNSCNVNGVADVPFNELGYQEAFDGQAYVGLATTAVGGAAWYREIVGIALTQPLQPGVPICLSFQTALGGFGRVPWNSTLYSSKGLGLKFFTAFPTDWSAYLYPNSAALHIDYVPTDTALWYGVSGVYIPDSAYTFIAVGNFFADSLSERTIIDSTGYGAFDVAYAFVDDVRASFDLSFCTQSTPNLDDWEPIRAFPMPCSDVLNVTRPGYMLGMLRYRILTMLGAPIADGTLVGSEEVSIPFGTLPNGSYILELMSGTSRNQVVHVVHLNQ